MNPIKMHHSAIFSAISLQFSRMSRISQRSLAISQQCEVQENLSAVRYKVYL